MPTADTLIARDGPVAVPLDYDQPAGSEIVPVCVTASFDGSVAGADYVPTLEVIAPDGRVVARCPTQETVGAGGSADVSWFPGVAPQGSSSPPTPSGLALLYDSGELAAPAAAIDTGAGGIAATYTHLFGFVMLRSTAGFGESVCDVQFNGDTNPNYDRFNLTIKQATLPILQAQAQNSGQPFNLSGSSEDPGRFSQGFFLVPFYRAAEQKVLVAYSSQPSQTQSQVGAMGWRSTVAISRMRVADLANAGNLDTGSRLMIYGI